MIFFTGGRCKKHLDQQAWAPDRALLEQLGAFGKAGLQFGADQALSKGETTV